MRVAQRRVGEQRELLRVTVASIGDAVITTDTEETARTLREQPWGGKMALIALTGWGQEEDKRRALEAGFDHHLTKPVDPTALEKLVALIAPVPER